MCLLFLLFYCAIFVCNYVQIKIYGRIKIKIYVYIINTNIIWSSAAGIRVAFIIMYLFGVTASL